MLVTNISKIRNEDLPFNNMEMRHGIFLQYGNR